MPPRTQLTACTASLILILGLSGAAVSASLSAAPFASNAQAATKLEVRLAESSPGAGLSEAIVPGSAEKIYLHPETIIGNGDVVLARVVPGDRPATFNVGIMFSSDGSAKMEKVAGAIAAGLNAR